MRCKKGGFVSIRHHDLRDLTANMSSKVCKSVEIEKKKQYRCQFWPQSTLEVGLCLMSSAYFKHWSASCFYYIAHIVAIATNYSNLLYEHLPMITNLSQCFAQPVYQWLPITCQYIKNHSIGNFLPIGSQCLRMALRNLTMALRNLP